MWKRLRNWYYRKVLHPIRTLLKQGVTPEKISLGIALAVAISICPLLGLPTLLCTVLAVTLRLNLPLMQIVNYLLTAPQWALIIPFLRAGEILFGAAPLPLHLDELRTLLEADFWSTLAWFWRCGMHAGLVWLITVPVVAVATYVMTIPAVRRLHRRYRPRQSTILN